MNDLYLEIEFRDKTGCIRREVVNMYPTEVVKSISIIRELEFSE